MARTYTDEERTRAILRAEELGSIRAAAREAGITPSTLSRWIRGDNQAQAQQIATQVKASMLARLEDGAMQFYTAMMNALADGKYSPGQLMTGFGIITDKVIALQRQTEETRDTTALDNLVTAIREARDE